MDFQSFSFFGAVGAAYLGGILASLTPCVYPMIPITLSVVGGMELPDGRGDSARRIRWHTVWVRATVYISGMAMTYAFLGVIAGLTGRVFGTLTNHPIGYFSLGVILTIASLVMLDVLSFDLVSLWERTKRRFGGGQTKSVEHSARKELSLLGAFFLGASSSVIAAPCTTPVMTGILGYIAQTQSVGMGFILMFAFALGLGTLLLMLAGFAGATRVLPRSGVWMVRFKHASGLLLLAFAEYLIYRSGQLGGIF